MLKWRGVVDIQADMNPKFEGIFVIYKQLVWSFVFKILSIYKQVVLSFIFTILSSSSHSTQVGII